MNIIIYLKLDVESDLLHSAFEQVDKYPQKLKEEKGSRSATWGEAECQLDQVAWHFEGEDEWD